MTWLVMMVYLLVGLGVFCGAREEGVGMWRAAGVAVLWPVFALVGIGRKIY